jgi:DNA modification methylase
MLELENAVVYHGSNLEVLPTLPDNSVDSIVTDPPYELGFMGKSWDSSGIAYSVELWAECMRVLKPGGHLLAFSGSRTYHRMVVAIEDAGFEIRDMISWISNKTFPKSHNIGKATGKDEWEGWGTALKPTVEPIVMARKPFSGTVAANVLAYGTGGLNIDASRIGTSDETARTPSPVSKESPAGMGFSPAMGGNGSPLGRWPANVILDNDCAEILDEQSGISKSVSSKRGVGFNDSSVYGSGNAEFDSIRGVTDSGGASRFFYVARASKSDRNEGLDELPNQISQHDSGGLGRETSVNKRINEQDINAPTTKNFHPTVKPTPLMEYLIKLVTPIGGVILDPFTGSGSTGKAALLNGYKFIGIELTEEYLPIIEGRLKWAIKQSKTETLF